MSKNPLPGSLIKKAWNKCKKIPKGYYLFSKVVGFMIPYTGTIKPIVTQLENGTAEVKLYDRRRVRNHLNSVHAIALANLGEFTTGLTIIPQLDQNANAILIRLEVIYLKKARGTLTANATYVLPPLQSGDTSHVVNAKITNETNDVVCEVNATWQVRVK